MREKKTATMRSGACRMRWCSALVAGLTIAAGASVSAAQPFPAADTLSPQQIRGRDLFNQSCLVCHVKLQITSPAKFGPDLSQKVLGGKDAMMREVISDGTPNMPAFKYLKALPAPPPANPNPPR
jgi:mono/diheme cytochrome c family protein